MPTIRKTFDAKSHADFQGTLVTKAFPIPISKNGSGLDSLKFYGIHGFSPYHRKIAEAYDTEEMKKFADEGHLHFIRAAYDKTNGMFRIGIVVLDKKGSNIIHTEDTDIHVKGTEKKTATALVGEYLKEWSNRAERLTGTRDKQYKITPNPGIEDQAPALSDALVVG